MFYPNIFKEMLKKKLLPKAKIQEFYYFYSFFWPKYSVFLEQHKINLISKKKLIENQDYTEKIL